MSGPAKPFFMPRHWQTEGLAENRYSYVTSRGPENRWKPPTKLYTKEAIDALGRATVENWDGSEVAARRELEAPQRPWLYFGAQQERPKVLTFDENGAPRYVDEERAEEWWRVASPRFVKEWELERAAALRWGEASNGLRILLAEGTLGATCTDRLGHEHEIPARLWATEIARSFLRIGFAKYPGEGRRRGHLVSGLILMNAAALESLLSRPKPTSEVLAPPIIDAGRHPYLAYMIRAANEIQFESPTRTFKKVIRDWLRDNWPTELGAPTRTKLDAMATFLRRPEDEAGGIRKSEDLTKGSDH